MLATLITGAARLMLAIAETLATQSGLDWAFCDTDSMALTKPVDVSEPEFRARVQAICEWFTPLNPYRTAVALFKVEDENKRILDGKTTNELEPLYCYAVSAKRYALFNLDAQGKPVIRKASAHGLGHWSPPYGDDHPPRAFPEPIVELEGIRRWQHDLWHRIIEAAQAARDTDTNPAGHRAFDRPVASPYHATTPQVLDWFDEYNDQRPFSEQVHPFNFLLAFQAGPLDAEPAIDAFAARKGRRRAAVDRLRPVAPYDKDPLKAAQKCFDRKTGTRVPVTALQTYREALAQYHLYPETKFLNGRYRDRGPTQRRHVKLDLTDINYIGKEANELDEQIFLGFDPEALPEFGLNAGAYEALSARVREALATPKLNAISKASGISTRYLRKIRDSAGNVSVAALKRIEKAIPSVAASFASENTREDELLDWARAEAESTGIRPLARRLHVDPANLAKVILGKRRASASLLAAIVILSRGEGA